LRLGKGISKVGGGGGGGKRRRKKRVKIKRGREEGATEGKGGEWIVRRE